MVLRHAAERWACTSSSARLVPMCLIHACMHRRFACAGSGVRAHGDRCGAATDRAWQRAAWHAAVLLSHPQPRCGTEAPVQLQGEGYHWGRCPDRVPGIHTGAVKSDKLPKSCWRIVVICAGPVFTALRLSPPQSARTVMLSSLDDHPAGCTHQDTLEC